MGVVLLLLFYLFEITLWISIKLIVFLFLKIDSISINNILLNKVDNSD